MGLGKMVQDKEVVKQEIINSVDALCSEWNNSSGFRARNLLLGKFLRVRENLLQRALENEGIDIFKDYPNNHPVGSFEYYGARAGQSLRMKCWPETEAELLDYQRIISEYKISRLEGGMHGGPGFKKYFDG